MNCNEYKNIICETPETEGLEYKLAVLWLQLSRMPIGVVSLNGCTDKSFYVQKHRVQQR